MAVCLECGIEYDDSKNYCIKCGSPLIKKPREKEKHSPKASPQAPYLNNTHTPEVLPPKKPNRAKMAIRITALLVIVAIAVVIFIFLPRMYKKMISKTPPDEEIVELLNKAHEYLEADKLTTPPGENAFEASQQILAEAPDNEDALLIQKEIVDRYSQWGDENYYKRDFQKAITYYRKALIVDDENIEVREKIAQAQRMIEEQKIIDETNRKIAEQKRLSELNIYLPLFNSEVVEKVVSLGHSPYSVLFLDNFESNKNDWPVEDTPDGPYLDFKNGRLTIEERTEEKAYWISKELKQDDFMVRFSIEYVSGTEENGAGIFFRAKSFSDYRHFISLDAAGDCYYQIGYYDSNKNKWVDIKEWTKSDIIRSKEENKVEAIVLGDMIHLYINGEFITSSSGLKNTSGNIFGFFCAVNGMRYAFDDICFIELKKRS